MILKLPTYFNFEDLRIMGIYFLIKKGKIVYIGKTKNLIGRLWSHELLGKFDSVRIIECGELKLDMYEKRWIIKFRPKYNRQHLFKKVGGWRIGYKFKEINKSTAEAVISRAESENRSINGQIEYELEKK